MARPFPIVATAMMIMLAMGTASCATASSADDITALHPPPGCDIFNNLTEEIASVSYTNVGGKFPSVGDSATYLDYLIDSHHKLVGTVFGELTVMYRKSNGDKIELGHETIKLPGGDVEVQGLFDVTRADKHIWVYGPAIGVSGGFRGKLGKRWFKIIKVGRLLKARLELCPAFIPAR